MTTHRGLTLVEILAATVLMAIVAGVCVPLLRQATRALDDRAAPFEMTELGQVADAVLADATAFGVDSASLDAGTSIEWPEHPQLPPITAYGLSCDDPAIAHRWLVFSSGGWVVYRWMEIEAQEEDAIP